MKFQKVGLGKAVGGIRNREREATEQESQNGCGMNDGKFFSVLAELLDKID